MISIIQHYICEIHPWLTTILCSPKKEKTPPVKLWHRALSLLIFILYLFKELF